MRADIAVYNSKNGTCGCYCDPCCAYTDFGMIPESPIVAVEGSDPVAPYGCYCNGQQDSLDATLTSADTSIAGAGGLNVSGVGPGQTTLTVEFAPVVQGGVECYGANDTQNCYSAPVTISPPPPVTVTQCGDPSTPQRGNRGALIQEYAAYHVDLQPTCSDFTDSASTQNFSFKELTAHEDYSWASLRQTLLTSIQIVRNDYGQPLTVDSGYRNPAHNAAIGGAKQSQHMYGLAIDFGTGENATEWNLLQAYAYTMDACVEPYGLDTTPYDHIHMDWRAGYPGTCPTVGGTWGPH